MSLRLQTLKTHISQSQSSLNTFKDPFLIHNSLKKNYIITILPVLNPIFNIWGGGGEQEKEAKTEEEKDEGTDTK